MVKHCLVTRTEVLSLSFSVTLVLMNRSSHLERGKEGGGYLMDFN